MKHGVKEGNKVAECECKYPRTHGHALLEDIDTLEPPDYRALLIEDTIASTVTAICQWLRNQGEILEPLPGEKMASIERAYAEGFARKLEAGEWKPVK